MEKDLMATPPLPVNPWKPGEHSPVIKWTAAGRL